MKLVLAFLFIVFTSISYSQIKRGGEETEENKEGESKYMSKGEMAVNCNTDIEIDHNLIYHRKTGKPYTGLCISFYDNRQLERKVRFVEGKRQDTSYTFYKDGTPWTQLCWEQDLENGVCKFWYENGQLAWDNTYVMGEKEGVWNYYTDEGKPSKKITYKKNTMEGPSKYYYPDGVLKKHVIYKDGVLHGDFITYYPDSTEKMRKTYKSGIDDGDVFFYFDNGQLALENHFSNGTKVDKWQFYYRDGQLKKEGLYKNDVKDGLWDTFQEDGKNLLSILYDQGEILIVVEYDKFGKAKNDNDLIELNLLLSGNAEKEKKAKEKAEKEAEKLKGKKTKEKKKKDKKSEWGYTK